MTRHTPLWEQSGSYAASDDRGLLSALWPGPAVTGCAVLPPASGMTVTVDPGYAAVPSANGTGTVLCHSDAVETVADFLPAPPAGTDRTDLVVCQSRGNDLDGGVNNDFIFQALAGAEAPAGTSTPPATPAGAVALAQVLVTGGMASIAAASITDVRPRLGTGVSEQPWTAPRGWVWVGVGPAAQADIVNAADWTFKATWMAQPYRRYRVSGYGRGQWLAAGGGASIRIAGTPAATPLQYQLLTEGSVAVNQPLVWTAVAWVHTAASYPQEVKAWLVGPNCRVFANGTMWLVEDMGGY